MHRCFCQKALDTYLDNDKLTGLFIWLFADCRVDENWSFGTRPKSQNNKGLFDIYRREKLALSKAKELFKKN